MSYSATKAALDTLKSLVPGNEEGTNCWTDKKGRSLFYELGDVCDGAVVGEVWRTEGALAHFVGYFKIKGNGIVERWVD